MESRDLIFIIVGVILVFALIGDNNNIIKMEPFSYFNRRRLACTPRRFRRRIVIEDDDNIIERCATIAKGYGENLFAIDNDICYVGPNYKNGCVGDVKIFGWN